MPFRARTRLLKDLDLYVIKPQAGRRGAGLAADTSAGRTWICARAGHGDYYLAVVDFAGTGTTYEICVATITFWRWPMRWIGLPVPVGVSPARIRRASETGSVPLRPSRP